MRGRYCYILGLFTLASLVTIQEAIKNVNKLDNESGKNDESVSSPGKVAVSCRTGSMCVHIDRRWMQSKWKEVDIEDLMLQEACDLTRETSEDRFTLCTPTGMMMSCGSEFAQNDTHLIFENEVRVLSPSTYHLRNPKMQAALPWKCEYPLKISVETQYLPEISPITIFRVNKTFSGEFKAAMFIYKDDEFQHAYKTIPYLNVDDRLRVKVQLLRGPEESTLQIVKCWAATEDEQQSYTLIDDFCPVASARLNVTMRNNGNLHHASWESRVFRFITQPKVYIHCHVRVCFHGTKCENSCQDVGDAKKRKRREIKNFDGGHLRLGPLEIDNDVAELLEDAKANEAQNKPGTDTVVKNDDAYLFGIPKTPAFILIGAIGLVCILLVVGVAACAARKSHEAKKKTKHYWENKLANRQRVSKTFTLSHQPPFEIPMSVPNTLTSSGELSNETRTTQ